MNTHSNCDWCNSSFAIKNKLHRFCSTPCRRKWHKKENGQTTLPSFIADKQKKRNKRFINFNEPFINQSPLKAVSSIESTDIAKIQTNINWLESQKINSNSDVKTFLESAVLFGGSRLLSKNLLINIGAAAIPFFFKKSPEEIQLRNANLQMQIDNEQVKIIALRNEQINNTPTPSPIKVHDNFKLISAKDVDSLENEKYDLHDRWRYFLNYMPTSFNGIIYGLPKAGKTHLALQFAQYLQNKFGDVIYVSGEEGVEEPFNQKLKKYNSTFKVAYDVKGSFGIMKLIEKVKPKFVFIDSLNRLGLNVNNIITFKENFPNTVFLYIVQSTKEGNFKGGQDIAHEVTSMIKVIDGVAHQKGRTVAEPTELQVFK